MTWTPFFSLIPLILLTTPTATAAVTAQPNWAIRSNEISLSFFKDLGQFRPALSAAIGLKEFEDSVRNFSQKSENDFQLFLKESLSKVSEHAAEKGDPQFRADMLLFKERLLNWMAQREQHTSGKKLNLTDPMQIIEESLSPYWAGEPSARKNEIILTRLKTLVSGSPSSKSVHSFLQKQMRSLVSKNGKRGVHYPLRHRVDAVIKNQKRAISRLQSQLEKLGLQAKTEKLMAQLKKRSSEYALYLSNHILKHARTARHINRDEYLLQLRRRNILLSPEAVVLKAQEHSEELRAQLTQLIQTELQDISTTTTQPIREIFQKLSRARHKDSSSTLQLFQKKLHLQKKSKPRSTALQTIKKQMKMRMEQFKIGPVLVPTTQVRPFFGPNTKISTHTFIPQASTHSLQHQDHFTVPAVPFWIAREVLPGKALLMEASHSQPRSLLRKLYSYDRVLLEGWGLYAAELSKGDFDPQARFITLHSLLYATQRALLEAQVFLGQLSADAFVSALVNRLGISASTAQSNADLLESRPGSQVVAFAGWLMLKESLSGEGTCALDTFLSYPLFPLRIEPRFLQNHCAEKNDEGSP